MKQYFLLALALVFLTGERVNGININLIQTSAWGPIPANSVGGGNLRTNVEAAAKVWLLGLPGDTTFSPQVTYGYDTNIACGTALTQVWAFDNGRPLRNKVVQIHIGTGNSGSYWFLDKNPLVATNALTSDSCYMNGFSVNCGRFCTLNTQGGVDLFTAVCHELGHAIGMLIGIPTMGNQVTNMTLTVCSPLPFAGLCIPLSGDGSHIAHCGQYGESLMSGTPAVGQRMYPSTLDILAVAQSGLFTSVNTDLVPWLKLIGPIPRTQMIQGKQKVVGYDARLEWVTPLGGNWIPIETANLASPTSWTAMTNAISVTNGTYSITIPVTGGNMNFRLMRN